MKLAQIDIQGLQELDAPTLLEEVLGAFGRRAAIGTSLQKTGLVIIDLASRLGVPFRVFFVDTLMNFDETYELLEEVERHYGLTVERYRPDPERLDWLYTTYGQNAHYFDRPTCCDIRKKLPLQEALGTLDAWIAGVRADQSDHRCEAAEQACRVRTADGRDILKVNPLMAWTAEQIDAYIHEHGLPYNKLYDYVSPYNERFQVIGCKPCHVPVKEGFGKRMGKFPWEQGAKECGIHSHGSGI
jgi:phosphoadenosine phosphosulfate reductase